MVWRTSSLSSPLEHLNSRSKADDPDDKYAAVLKVEELDFTDRGL